SGKFLKVSPTMPMNDLHNTREVACIAQVGRANRQLLQQRCGAAEADRLVMVAMGGIEYRLSMERWPVIPGVRWLVPEAWDIRRDDVTAFESTGLGFRDVLASCDAILTKPGYGTFAEAACAGVPVMYVSRGDWPEAPYLVDWVRQYGVAVEIEPVRLQTGALHEVLAALWSKQSAALPQNTGAAEVVETLCEMLT
ncbi:MAG: hypothetical protein PHP05_07485, partial [Sideroxydans sp.]|nr:hypothetical protein [Sideroxydans sp.]